MCMEREVKGNEREIKESKREMKMKGNEREMKGKWKEKLSDPSPYNILNNIQIFTCSNISLSCDGDEDGSESRRSNFFQKCGSSYVVSAPVSLGNYPVKFFHPFDVSVMLKVFFLKIK